MAAKPSAEDLLKKLRTNLAARDQKINELTTSIAEEREKARATISELTASCEQKTADLASVTSALAAEQARNAKVADDVTAMYEQKIDEINEMLENERQNVAKLTAELGTSKQKINELTAELSVTDSCKLRIDELNRTITTLNTDITDYKFKINRLTSENESCAATYKKQIDELTAKLTGAEESKLQVDKLLADAREQTNASLAKSEAKVGELTSALAAEQDKVAKLSADIATCENKITAAMVNEYGKIINSHEETVEKLKKEFAAKLESVTAEFNQKIEDAKSQAAAEKARNESLRASLMEILSADDEAFGASQ